MRQRVRDFFSTPLQLVLVISFSLIAASTFAIGSWVITQTINDYLSASMNERVARDMQLAEAFYNLKLHEIEGIAARVSKDPLILNNLKKAAQGENVSTFINQQIAVELSSPGLQGNHVILVLDNDGKVVAGQLQSATGDQQKLLSGANWKSLDLVKEVLASGIPIVATGIIPADLLAQEGLAKQASIQILDTPKASSELFDAREGNAGLALVSVTPIKNEGGAIIGLTLAFHLLNNDFTIVDRIKDVAGIDTATIFFGDLRVSTNVMTLDGLRAIGTRLSQEVSDVVLRNGEEFVGPAFVVNADYITRYDPLRDHLGRVIGIIYVGAKQASFQRLLNNFNQRILLVALGTILLTIIITVPVSRVITNPLNQLKVLANANRQVAGGDMSIRVPVSTGGEVGLLENSFNSMLDTLQTTQDQLVQSEKLASLGQLAAGVAHELNNPLGTILLYSDILLKELSPDSPIKADLEVIVNETKRCKGIVAALLEFARQNQVVAQPTNLNAVIRDAVGRELKQQQNVPIEVMDLLDPDLPTIQADTAQLYQVVVNLVENAIHAMPEGGKLKLSTHLGPAGMVTFELEDTGEGISADNYPKLFTPFFTTKPMGKGTGLGLAIVYGIIKLHRGQINIRSEVGIGTRVTIQLPIKLRGIANSDSQASQLIESK